MTATTTRAKAAARVQCPHCGYSAEPGSSIAGHVAMAHPDVPMDTVAPKRPASYVANGEQLADQVSPKRSARNDDQHIPAAPAVATAAGAATLVDIPLELVDVGDNVRVTLEAIDELAASIAEHGVLQPVKATLLPSGRYSLLWGQRRVLAKERASEQKRVAKEALATQVQQHVKRTASGWAIPEGRAIAIDRILAEAALWGLLSYRIPTWAEAHGGKKNNPFAAIHALSDEDLAKELAMEIANDFRDKAGYHVNWPDLAAELGVEP